MSWTVGCPQEWTNERMNDGGGHVPAGEFAPGCGLVLEILDNVALVTWYGEDQYNSIHALNIRVFPKIIEFAEGVPSVTHLVLQGSRGVFCTGGAPELLLDTSRRSFEERVAVFRAGQKWLSALLSSRLLTIAAVDGLVAGAGVDLLLAFDCVKLGKRARMNMSYSRVGVIPDLGGLELLAERFGRAGALKMYLSNATSDAEELQALKLGSIDDGLPVSSEGWALYVNKKIQITPSGFTAAKMVLWSSRSTHFDNHQQQVAREQAKLATGEAFEQRVRRLQAFRAILQKKP